MGRVNHVTFPVSIHMADTPLQMLQVALDSKIARLDVVRVACEDEKNVPETKITDLEATLVKERA